MLSRTEVMNRYVRSIFHAVRYGKLHVGAPQAGRAAIVRRLYVIQEIDLSHDVIAAPAGARTGFNRACPECPVKSCTEPITGFDRARTGI